jgi:short-subunit dehydrogenase
MEKISIISGGASGLGLEIARLLLGNGKTVLLLGRNSAKLADVSHELKKTRSGVEYLACNVGNQEDIDAVGDYLSKKSYSVEYLFNNAGSGLFTAAQNSRAELVDKVFEASLKGMILLTSEILRRTPEEEELTIVNIMSTSALVGRAEETIYCAAKWGARGYTEALRVELKGTRRNIIGVYPGGMRTDFWQIPGQDRNISNFMDPAEVAEKIVNAVIVTDKLFVTDITINRKK